MPSRKFNSIPLFLCAVALTACFDGGNDPFWPRAGETDSPLANINAQSPGGLVDITVMSKQMVFWPFTGVDVNGTQADPINLIFVGKADPRALRAALMSLDGDRAALGLPNQPPFNCRWTDAYGDVQATYATNAGWTGSVIQLACGDFGPIRFHLRLFQAGDYTIANAHFELMIPGTADHQVLSWELAESFVVGDFMRTGLLEASNPMATSPVINPVPSYRTIPAVIFNELPAELKYLVTGSPANASADVPIANNGVATVLNVATAAAIVPGTTSETLNIVYNQVLPRPFCSTGPADYVFVQGPVTLTRRSTQTSGGVITVELDANGTVNITPVNPLTGEPTGPSSQASIRDTHRLFLADNASGVNSVTMRKETHANGAAGTSLTTHLEISGRGRGNFTRQESCGN